MLQIPEHPVRFGLTHQKNLELYEKPVPGETSISGS